jgi:hypothetical protein
MFVSEEIPNSKSQIPNNLQCPKSQGKGALVIWNLGLVFGAWDLGF